MEANNREEDTLKFDFKDLLDQQKVLEFQLNQLAAQRSDTVKTLPDLTKKRISALKKLQREHLDVEAKFYEDVHKLACKLQQSLVSNIEQRNKIINGQYTPNEEDLFENDEDLDSANSVPNPPNFEDNGIPDFWLTVLKCGKLTGELIQPQDEPILKHLTNMRVIMLENDPMGFNIEFIFSPNEYFSNNILTKTYYLKFDVDNEAPFSYEGPEIYKSKGCTINWFKGKNATVKTVKKRQKHKASPATRIVTKSVKIQSFFNFFSPPKMPADSEVLDDKVGEEIDLDFEIGHYINQRLIPRAVLYFTGEEIDIEEESDYEESEEETETDDEEEEETAVYNKRGNKIINNDDSP